MCSEIRRLVGENKCRDEGDGENSSASAGCSGPGGPSARSVETQISNIKDETVVCRTVDVATMGEGQQVGMTD